MNLTRCASLCFYLGTLAFAVRAAREGHRIDIVAAGVSALAGATFGLASTRVVRALSQE
jgi:hypothetical protein